MGCTRTILLGLALFFAAPAFAQVSPTPTPPRLSVTAKLLQMSGRSIIACNVKDRSGTPVASQTVSVQKSSKTTGPFANWMSKKTGVKGQALFPYSQPKNTWYVRCRAAGNVSLPKMIKGRSPSPSPTATPRPTSSAAPTPTPKPTVMPTVTPSPTSRPTATPTPTPRPTVTPTPTPSGTGINIDANWLQQHGPAPYILNQASTTYVLQTDVTSSGTALIVLNHDITLDLNGHTVTYGNSQPITVTNGGFEQGTGTNVPGWNLARRRMRR